MTSQQIKFNKDIVVMNKNQTKILELKHRKIEMEKTKQNPE